MGTSSTGKLHPQVLAEIIAARSHDAILTIEGYCDQSECSAREVEIFVKDFDDTFLSVLSRRGLSCPVCGVQLKVHHVVARRDESDPMFGKSIVLADAKPR